MIIIKYVDMSTEFFMVLVLGRQLVSMSPCGRLRFFRGGSAVKKFGRKLPRSVAAPNGPLTKEEL